LQHLLAEIAVSTIEQINTARHTQLLRLFSNAYFAKKMEQMSEVLREWTENANAWQEHKATIRTMFAPVTAMRPCSSVADTY
jgi:hypothetical protein